MAIPRNRFEDLSFAKKLTLVVLFPFFAIIALLGYAIDWLGHIFDTVHDELFEKEDNDNTA
ncbi:hypothetical protein [Xanthomonas phage DES1]|nr:hypothetical protein [Xanthomonas phage DES1]